MSSSEQRETPVWPPQDAAILAALEAAWHSGDWGRYAGANVAELERRLAELHQVAHAFTCSSGTIAVELALRAAGITAGDDVLLAGYDFPGNFRCIEAIGARPILVDIDPETWCLDVGLLEQLPSNLTPRALIVSHLHGGLAPMRALRAWADERRVAIVEDACQSPGAIVDGRTAGGWGDVGVLSFGGSKLLTAGRGGALVTNSASAYQRVKIFTDRGNHAFPLSELQAAVVLPQLAELAERNARRAANVARLRSRLTDLQELVPVSIPPERGSAAYYKFAWRAEGQLRAARDRFLAAAIAAGLQLGAGFRGFARRGPGRCQRVGQLPYSIEAAEATVLLHHPVLLGEAADIDHAADLLKRTVREILASEP